MKSFKRGGEEERFDLGHFGKKGRRMGNGWAVVSREESD